MYENLPQSLFFLVGGSDFNCLWLRSLTLTFDCLQNQLKKKKHNRIKTIFLSNPKWLTIANQGEKKISNDCRNRRPRKWNILLRKNPLNWRWFWYFERTFQRNWEQVFHTIYVEAPRGYCNWTSVYDIDTITCYYIHAQP